MIKPFAVLTSIFLLHLSQAQPTIGSGDVVGKVTASFNAGENYTADQAKAAINSKAGPGCFSSVSCEVRPRALGGKTINFGNCSAIPISGQCVSCTQKRTTPRGSACANCPEGYGSVSIPLGAKGEETHMVFCRKSEGSADESNSSGIENHENQ